MRNRSMIPNIQDSSVAEYNGISDSSKKSPAATYVIIENNYGGVYIDVH